MTKAIWYFDVISPYAYLHLKQFAKIAQPLDIEYRPVLFAGLLKHWETKGPAELPAKRRHTYRQCVWTARVNGLAAGVWGVPTFELDGELFWGADTIDFMNAFLADRTLFAQPDMRRADAAEVGAARKP